jgi:coiled-coil domain-containing protein 55
MCPRMPRTRLSFRSQCLSFRQTSRIPVKLLYQHCIMPTLAFGLNAAKSKAPPSKAPQKRKNLFDDGSDGEGDLPSNNGNVSALGGFPDDPSRPRKSPKLDAPAKNGVPTQKYTNLASLHSAKKQDAAASQVDSTIYDYDDAYETFHAPKAAANDSAGKSSGPKYMTSLLQSAEVRKRDQLRAKEKLLQKEREAEGDEFADKEKFVTGAYKAQQEEMRKLEEEERRQDAEEAERKKKGGGMQGFYKDLLRKDEERSALIAKAAEEAAQKPKDGPVVEEKPEELEAAQKAADLNAKGARIVVNDEGEVVDKRQLLSAGLNVAAKPKTATSTADTSSSEAKQEGYTRSSAARSARESQRERQSRMMEAQLEEIAAKQREQELEEERVREEKVKSTKSTTDVQSARERYLARKREREEEAKKAKGAG